VRHNSKSVVIYVFLLFVFMLLFQFMVASQLLDGLLAFGGQICISQCLGSSVRIQIRILEQFIYMYYEISESQLVHTRGFHAA